MMKKSVLFIGCLLCTSLLAAQNVYTLEDCRKMALDNNKSNKIAQAESTKAEYERKAAVTKFFPDLSIKGAYVRNGDELSLISEDIFLPIGTMSNGSFSLTPSQINNSWTILGGQAVPLDANGVPFDPRKNPEKIQWKEYTTIPADQLTYDTRNIYVASLNLTQPVFMGGKIIAYNKICKLKKELADSKLNTLQEEILVNIDETYWQIVSLTSKKKAVEGLINLLNKMDQDVTTLIETGMATKTDQLSVAVKKNEAEMALFKVENGIHLSKMLLAQYCGIPLTEEFTLEDENNESLDLAVTEPVNMDEVYQKRSEIKSLSIASKLYKEKEHIERAKLMPSIALIGSYAGSNPSFKNGFDTKFEFDWHIGVTVNIPLLHWGENIFTLKAAKCETAIAQYKEEDTKEKIELQVTQSEFKHSEALRKLEISTRNYNKAEENLKQATIGFEEGVIPASNLMEAQTAWLSAKSNVIESAIEAKVSEINYKKAIGTLLNQ